MIVDGELDQVQIGMRVWTTFHKMGGEGPGDVIHYGYKFHPEL